MKQIIKFKEWDCVLNVGYYPNNRLALWLTGAPETEYEGENIATCTVNLPDDPLEDNQVHIKTWSENEGMTDALIKAEVIKPVIQLVPVGPYGAMANLCEITFVPIVKPKN